MKNLITQIVTFPNRLSNTEAGVTESLVFTLCGMALIAAVTVFINN